MNERVYKIQNPKTGEFRCGGTYSRYSKRGKTWSQRGHVTSHLSQHHEYRRTHDGNDVVIAYELVEVERIPVKEWKKK